MSNFFCKTIWLLVVVPFVFCCCPISASQCVLRDGPAFSSRCPAAYSYPVLAHFDTLSDTGSCIYVLLFSLFRSTCVYVCVCCCWPLVPLSLFISSAGRKVAEASDTTCHKGMHTVGYKLFLLKRLSWIKNDLMVVFCFAVLAGDVI